MHSLLQHTTSKYIDTKLTCLSVTPSYCSYFPIHMHASAQSNTTQQPLICCVRIILQPLPFYKGGVVGKKTNTLKRKEVWGICGISKRCATVWKRLLNNPQLVTMGWSKAKKKRKKRNAIPYGLSCSIQCRSDLAPLLCVCNHRFPLPSLTSPH